MKTALWIYFILLFTSFLLKPISVFAQEPGFGIATTFTLADTTYEDADIVSFTDTTDNFTITSVGYDERMYGVINLNPPVVYEITANGIPIIRSGEVMVNVTTVNGPIAIGDYVTSSKIPGKGQKATEYTGYMLGVALESFDDSSGTPIDFEGQEVVAGRIKVAVGIGPASPILKKVTGGLFGTAKHLTTSFLFNIVTPKETDRVIRYILAIIVILITFYTSYKTFGRNVTKGVEAIGRNPLARASIQTMIILNIGLIALISIGGIILSLAIISL